MNDLDKFRQEWLEEVASRNNNKTNTGINNTSDKGKTHNPKFLNPRFNDLVNNSGNQIDELVNETEQVSISEDTNGLGDLNGSTSLKKAHDKTRSAQSSTRHAPPSSTLDKDSVFLFHAGANMFEKDVSHYTPDQARAVALFEQAVEKEHTGKLQDAVVLYRDAFKVDDSADKLYRMKWFSHYKTSTYVADNGGAKNGGSSSSGVSNGNTVSARLEELERIEREKKKKKSAEKNRHKHKNGESSNGNAATAAGEKATLDSSKMTIEEKKKMYADMEEALEEDVADEDLLSAEKALPAFDDLTITPLDETLPSPFATLPIEIISKIVMDLALSDLPSFRSIMCTCKMFHGVGMTSTDIWKALGMKEYPFQKYIPPVWANLAGEKIEKTENGDENEGEGEEADEEEDEETEVQDERDELESVFASPANTLKTEKSHTSRELQEKKVLWNPSHPWYGNWRSMYLQRPRVRFDGTYISTCNYMRPGRSDDGWNQPFIMVTYYRYIRMFKDGTCLTYLTTDEPRDIVPVFVKPKPHEQRSSSRNKKRTNKDVYSVTRPDGTIIYRPREICSGRWVHVNPAGQILVKTEGSAENYTFYMRLDLRSSGRRRHNKLKWHDYWALDHNEDRVEFNLKNDKSFYFQKYRYEKA